MPNYKQILGFQILETIPNMLGEIPNAEFAARIKALSDYLREGYKYAANVNDPRVRKIDITRHADHIHLLIMMAQDMVKADVNFSWMYKRIDGTIISVEPIFDFCEDMTADDWTDFIDDLEDLRKVMINYVNPSNVWEFRDCSDILERLYSIFSELNKTVQRYFEKHPEEQE
jgi:hypothetical protein